MLDFPYESLEWACSATAGDLIALEMICSPSAPLSKYCLQLSRQLL